MYCSYLFIFDMVVIYCLYILSFDYIKKNSMNIFITFFSFYVIVKTSYLKFLWFVNLFSLYKKSQKIFENKCTNHEKIIFFKFTLYFLQTELLLLLLMSKRVTLQLTTYDIILLVATLKSDHSNQQFVALNSIPFTFFIVFNIARFIIVE